jgi:RNA polymerase sigma-70 factor (ECF subfamily)
LTSAELDRFYAGDPDFFRQLYQRYTPELLDSARHLTETKEDAQDVVQEAWLRVFARRHSYTGDGSLRGWIHAIVRAVGLDYYRSVKRRSRKLTLFEIMQAAEPRVQQTPLPTDAHATRPADVVRHRWRTRGDLIDAIIRLTPRQRDTIVLRFLAGRKTRDVARVLGISEATVRALVHQGLHSLQRKMRRFDPSEFEFQSDD